MASFQKLKFIFILSLLMLKICPKWFNVTLGVSFDDSFSGFLNEKKLLRRLDHLVSWFWGNIFNKNWQEIDKPEKFKEKRKHRRNKFIILTGKVSAKEKGERKKQRIRSKFDGSSRSDNHSLTKRLKYQKKMS